MSDREGRIPRLAAFPSWPAQQTAPVNFSEVCLQIGQGLERLGILFEAGSQPSRLVRLTAAPSTVLPLPRSTAAGAARAIASFCNVLPRTGTTLAVPFSMSDESSNLGDAGWLVTFGAGSA